MLVLQPLVDDVTAAIQTKNQYGVEELCTSGCATTCHPPARLLADNEGCNGCGAAWSEVTTAVSFDSGVAARWNRVQDSDDWNQTLYSLRFAVSLPVAVKPYDTFMSDRTREIVQLTIDRLGHLAPPRPSAVLAEGTFARARDKLEMVEFERRSRHSASKRRWTRPAGATGAAPV